MRIAVDFSSIASGGGLTHVAGWVTAAAAHDHHNTYLLLAPRKVPPGVRALPPSFQWATPPLQPRSASLRVVWEQVWLPLWLRAKRPDVLFSTADRTVLAAPCPTVLLIQNMNPYAGPPARTAAGKLRERTLALFAHASARRARRVVFVSHASRAVIAPALHLPLGRTSVVYHGVDHTRFHPGTGPAAPSTAPYLLTVSTIRPHKDLDALISAFARVAGAGHDPLQLRIAAPVVDAVYLDRLRAQARRLGVEGRIAFLGAVAPDALPDLYRGAIALVLTSRVETFGLPLIEAMACGTPVVTSDIRVAREVCQDAAQYYAPGNVDAMAARIASIVADPGSADRVRAAGIHRAAAFTWDRAFLQTLAILEAAAEGRAMSGSL